MLAHIITTAGNDGLIWAPRPDRAHSGRMGSTAALHFPRNRRQQ